MKKVGSMLAVAMIMAAAAPFVSAQTGPTLVVEEKIIDLGEVPKGAVEDVVFSLKNTGDSTLIIKSVRPTCGCTVAEFDTEIPAGETGTIRAKLDTEDFKGAISKSVIVMSNDLANTPMTLAIKAVVLPYIEALPRALVRLNALQKEPAEQKVVLAGTERSGDFKITGVEAESDAIEVSYRALAEHESIEGKGQPQYEVAIRLAEDAPVGPINSVVKVTTTSPKAPSMDVKVFGVVRAILPVTPPELQFGAVEASQAPSRNLIIVNNRPKSSVDITSATLDDPAFSVELVPVEAGKRYRATVSVNREATPGIKDATLVLKTTDADFPELIVPVRASLR